MGYRTNRQAAWCEGNNSWHNHSKMEVVQDDGQSPSVWGNNDHEESEGSAQNCMAGPGQ